MHRENFIATISELHALFGRERPASSHTLSPLWERVKDWPDGVLPLLVERLELSERLPANLYREFRAAWDEWRRHNPERIVRVPCAVCGDRGVFYCWVRNGGDGAEGWTHFCSPCPHCQTGTGRRPPSQLELRARGVEIMPSDYAGGPTAYDRDRGFGVLCPAWMRDAKPEDDTRSRLAARRQALAVGVDMTPDPRRLAALSPAERADAAACEF